VSVESVDFNSSADECAGSGGVWIDNPVETVAVTDTDSCSPTNLSACPQTETPNLQAQIPYDVPKFIWMPLPSNALACSTNTGVNFNAPPGFSVSNIAANGQTNGLLGADAAVGQGGYYDFQRFQVGATTEFFQGYTPVANIAVGAYLYGAGVSPAAGSLISNTYAFFKSKNGATAQQGQFRNLGFSLASGKATYSCQSPP
jgi:hypothetical protein